MKLRNKKTGEIKAVNHAKILIHFSDGTTQAIKSLVELNKDWEDYKPAEPLIKDEKIRKAVRAWWETLPDRMADKRIIYKENRDLAVGVYSIYCGVIYPETLEKGKMYSITELCGEDEE